MTLIPVNAQNFASRRWRPLPNALFAQAVTLAELNANELPGAVCHLPTGFIRSAEGQYTLHALLGIQPGKNLFVTADGSWLGGYWPLRLRLAPFALATSENNDQVLCVNDAWWQPTEADGYPFYDAENNLSKETTVLMQECQALLANQQQTHAAVAALDEAGLICPWNPVVATESLGSVQLEGLFSMNEEALNAINADALLKLRDCGALAIAYCQLISMQHLHKLAELADAHARYAQQSVQVQNDMLNLNFLVE